MFKRAADERTLKQQAKDLDAADQRGLALRRATIQDACEKCYEEWRNCVRADPAIEAGQCAGFNRCVDLRGFKASSCIMHH